MTATAKTFQAQDPNAKPVKTTVIVSRPIKDAPKGVKAQVGEFADGSARLTIKHGGKAFDFSYKWKRGLQRAVAKFKARPVQYIENHAPAELLAKAA